MSPIKAPANLPDLVRTTFNKAKASGDINFYPTQVAVVTPASTPFQLRFSPSLANKPKPPPPSGSSSSSPDPPKKQQQPPSPPPFNPFAHPPPALTITPLAPNHLLVLNKFAIVPEHFILITRTFKPQTHLLEAEDLAAAYACIRAYHEYEGEGAGAGERGGQQLFVFFNSGAHSGASQMHRHLQLLPVARMRDGLLDADAGAGADARKKWTVLADRLVVVGEDEETAAAAAAAERHAALSLPFATFAERIPRLGMEAGEDLRAIYLRLYRKAYLAVAGTGVGAGGAPPPPPAAGDIDDDAHLAGGGGADSVEAQISYNLAMTRDTMVLCPRLAEGDVVRDKAGREVGRLALNGTVLAGTALVKSQQEWDALRGDDGKQLWEILGKIGLPF